MARIFKHPALTDYFVEFDASAATLEGVATAFETGRVVLLRNTRIDYDAKFLATVEFPNEPEYKKFKSVRFARDWFESGRIDAEVLNRCFSGDRGRVDHFASQVRNVNEQLRTLTRRLVPNYRLTTDLISWRLSETANENLHIDTYDPEKEDVIDHHFRLFLNIDDAPRIWHTSYTLQELLDRNLDRLDPMFVRKATPGKLLHALNLAVFGLWELAGREGAPKHIAFFDPGDVWLVDSFQVAHQVFWGRRVVSTDFSVDASSMEDPSRHRFAVVERRRQGRDGTRPVDPSKRNSRST